VCFHIEFNETFNLSNGIDLNFFKTMKLTGSIPVSNIVLFDRNGKLRKFTGPLEILKDFFDLRLSYYDKRKEALKKKLMEELKKLTNQMNFILAVVEGKLKILKRKRKDICRDLANMGFDRIYPKAKKSDNNKEEQEEKLQEEAGGDSLVQGYNYLLRMPIYSLTLEKVEEITAQRQRKLDELDILCKTRVQDIWLKDLVTFEQSLNEHEKEQQEALEEEAKFGKKKEERSQNKGKEGQKGKKDSPRLLQQPQQTRRLRKHHGLLCYHGGPLERRARRQKAQEEGRLKDVFRCPHAKGRLGQYHHLRLRVQSHVQL